MGLEFKATCDKGPDHPGPFFSVYIRVKEVRAGKGGSRNVKRLFDRLRIAGVFCARCLDSGALTVSLPQFGILAAKGR